MNQNTISENLNTTPIQYCTVQQIVNDPSFCFTESMLRYYILHSHKNGLKKAIRKVGRKVLIRRDLFVKWLEDQACKMTTYP